VLTTGPILRAQQYTPWEAGVGILSQTASVWSAQDNYVGPRHIFAGPQGRYTWNLSPSLAIEGSVAYLSGFQTSTYGGDNGHELLALGGVKAGWRGRRFGVYGKAKPGISSWSPGLLTGYGPPPHYSPIYQRRTDFTLDVGGVFEAYPTQRTILRFDISSILIAEYDQVVFRSGALEGIAPGHIAQHLGLGFTVGHRFGGFRDEQEREPVRSMADVGILFSLHQRVHEAEGVDPILPNRGGGAWISWNFSRYVSLDGTAFYSPQDDHLDFPQDGGHDFVALAGIKAGIRRDRLGYFVTVRPGMIQFSRTNYYQDFNVTPPIDGSAKTTDFITNFGGALEFYPTTHLVLRADVGNATVHYHAANLAYTTSAASISTHDIYYRPFQSPSILTLFGVGWRF
jgi:hypothetical protein